MQRSVQYGSIERGCEEEGAEEGGALGDATSGVGMHPQSDGFPRRAIVGYRMPVVATFLGCLCCVVAVPWLLMALLMSWSDCSKGEWWSRPGVVCAASNASMILFTMTGGVFGLSAAAERGALGTKGKVVLAAVLGAQVRGRVCFVNVCCSCAAAWFTLQCISCVWASPSIRAGVGAVEHCGGGRDLHGDQPLVLGASCASE